VRNVIWSRNAAVWQKEKDHVQMGGGHGGGSQDGTSVERISSENFLVVVSEIQCDSKQEQYCRVMLMGAGS